MTAIDLDILAPASVMLRALRARQISAVELLERHLRRIERFNPALNASSSPITRGRGSGRRRWMQHGRAAKTRRCSACR